ncbi:rod shape-determining protein MreC [Patescibacteria group bacterium]|nr:rod shape-determining protein MreC [Patescibacteria group bacterium]
MSRFSENKFYYLIVSVAIIIIFSILHVVGILKPVESYFVRFISPVQSFFYRQGQGLSNFWSLLSSVRQISTDNNRLEEETELLRADVSRLKEIENENKLLREQLGFSEKNPFETIPSLVVSSDPSTTLQFINIDKGRKDGVQAGKPAVSSTGIMVGKVIEVEDKTAKVLLLTDTNSSIVGITQDTRANGLIKGEHGLALKMSTIAQDKDVKPGEKVVTAGMEENVPKGLLIGEIEEIISYDNELFKEAKVKPLANFNKVEMVFILK